MRDIFKFYKIYEKEKWEESNWSDRVIELHLKWGTMWSFCTFIICLLQSVYLFIRAQMMTTYLYKRWIHHHHSSLNYLYFYIFFTSHSSLPPFHFKWNILVGLPVIRTLTLQFLFYFIFERKKNYFLGSKLNYYIIYLNFYDHYDKKIFVI